MQEIDLIFQQYYRPLCLYATHYLHDIDEAEDVVQDCFVKLISRSIMPENIKAFLYTSQHRPVAPPVSDRYGDFSYRFMCRDF